jgi:hypothetical protein
MHILQTSRYITDLITIGTDAMHVNNCRHFGGVSIIVQKDATLYSVYSLQTALHVSGDTLTHHQDRE